MSEWEALPQRTRKRRSGGAASGGASAPPSGAPSDSSTVRASAAGPSSKTGNDTASQSESAAARSQQLIPSPGHDRDSVVEGQASTPGTVHGQREKDKSIGGTEEVVTIGKGGPIGRDDDEATEGRHAARHAAVATAVEERSKIERFSGGLEGGAGADGTNFEYLDHTADVQLHSWGASIEQAMEGALAAMFNVITDIGKLDINPSLTREIDVKGHDAMSMLFALLDEFLFVFHAEAFAVKKPTVGTVDRETWSLKATAEGETFDLSKHPQGTEVKAITYSNMQINEDATTGRTDIYVIVDI